MFANVTLSEPTLFFPHSSQDSNSLQDVILMPLVGFFVPSAPNTQNTIQNPRETTSNYLSM